MDFRNFFPLNIMVKRRDVASLVLAIIVYVGVSAAAGIVTRFLGWIPVLGWVLRITSFFIGLYCLAGIVLAALEFSGN